MAREYARLMTAIWRNQEFRALDAAEQRLYLLLVTQPDISAAGLLPLRVRRWAEMAKDTTPDAIVAALRMLDAGRFVVVDFDTEEVLVRAFVRWDGGFTNSKRRPVIIRDSEDIGSTRLRRVLAVEFERCGLPPLTITEPPDDPSGDALDETAEKAGRMAAGRQRNGARSHRPTAPDAVSDGACDGACDRPYTESPMMVDGELSPQVDSASDRTPPFTGVVVTQVEYGDTTTPNPKTTTPSASRDPAQTIIGAWIDGCRKRPPTAVIGQTAKVIKALLDEGIEPDDVRSGVELWAAKGLHPSSLPSVVNEVMNRPRQPMLRAVGDAGRVQGTSSQRANAILALRRGDPR